MTLYTSGISKIKFWLKQNLIALDQQGNTILGGYADETLSSRAWRMQVQNKFFGKLFVPIIDTLARIIGGENNHCFESYMSEKERRQYPPEERFTSVVQ